MGIFEKEVEEHFLYKLVLTLVFKVVGLQFLKMLESLSSSWMNSSKQSNKF